jgi:hypothetical protein
MSARGLKDPLLVVLDGAPGLLKAVKRVWPRTERDDARFGRVGQLVVPRSFGRMAGESLGQ